MSTRPFRSRPAVRLLALVATGLALGCEREPDIVLYASADSYVVDEVVAAYEARTGVDVEVVGDTEATKTTGLAERLRAERDAPVADVFWSSEVFMVSRLAEEGVLAPYESEATTGRPGPRGPDGRWHGFAARARVIAYAPDRVPPDAVPRTWMDLTDERFRGRVVMADPRFGTTRGHVGAMKAWWDRHAMPGYFEAYLEGLAENEIELLTSGNAGVVRAIVSGEADVGMTDTDDVWAAREAGANVELVYPWHGEPGEPGAGTLLIPNAVGLVAGTERPDAAADLIDFLLSEEVERILAESPSHNVPLRPGLAAEFERYAVPEPLNVSYEAAAEAMDDAVARAMEVLAGDRE